MPRLSANSYFVVSKVGLGGVRSRLDSKRQHVMMCAHRSSGRRLTVVSHLGNCVVHDLLVRHIALVSDEELVDALCGISVDLLQPLLHVVERIHVGDIVDDADTVGTSVVGRSDGSETLLPCGVPLRGDESLLAAASRALGRGRCWGWTWGWLTICSLTVLPSSSIVRIFYRSVSEMDLGCGDRGERTKSTPIVEM